METLIIKMPEGVEPPKFELFEAVIYGGHNCVISGLCYTSPLDALVLCQRRYGWQYAITYTFGKSLEEAVGASEQEAGIWGDNIQSAKLEAVSHG